MLAFVYLVLSASTGFIFIKYLLPSLSKNWIISLPASFLSGSVILAWITYIASYALRSTADPLFYGNIVAFAIGTVSLIFAIIRIFTAIADSAIDDSAMANTAIADSVTANSVIANTAITNTTIKNNALANDSITNNAIENAGVRADADANTITSVYNTSSSKLTIFNKNILSKNNLNKKRLNNNNNNNNNNKNSNMLIFVAVSMIFWGFFMFRSFNVSDGVINIGFSVFSDFAPHTAIIRSFSQGSNFPTVYPHFPDGSMRYHFMFYFLTGNLEYLGLRIDLALNILSVLSITAFLMLLYELTYIITEKPAAGYLTSLFFTFRSSFSFFPYIADIIKDKGFPGFLSVLLNNEIHIGRTMYEDWGLWAQKVYINQRHLAFALGIMIIILIVFLDLLRNSSLITAGNYTEYISSGILLGLTSYFNGAVVIATLSVLFVMAIFSKHKLKYLHAAIFATLLTLAQTKFFENGGNSIVTPEIKFGFLAFDATLPGVAAYFTELLGLLPHIAIAGLFIVFIYRGRKPFCENYSVLTLAFFAPIILATILKLTPDIAVNHKYVMIGMILLGIPVSYIICKLFSSKIFFIKTAAVLLTTTLIITGIIDIVTQFNIDKKHFGYHEDNKLAVWAVENTDKKDIFLTAANTYHPILYAGRGIFNGWPYYAWSAGYDTKEREKIARKIFEGDDVNNTISMLRANNIKYIVIDKVSKESDEAILGYVINEEFFDNNFELVFSDDMYKVFKAETTEINAGVKAGLKSEINAGVKAGLRTGMKEGQ